MSPAVRGSVKDEGGWEDYSVCVFKHVCRRMCLYAFGGRILTYFTSNILWQNDDSPLLWVCSIHTLLGQLYSVNWSKAAGPETLCILLESTHTIIWQCVISFFSVYLHALNSLPILYKSGLVHNNLNFKKVSTALRSFSILTPSGR